MCFNLEGSVLLFYFYVMLFELVDISELEDDMLLCGLVEVFVW